MIYCDTSFLVALSIRGELFTPTAVRLASSFQDPIPLVAIAEIEWKTRIHRRKSWFNISLRWVFQFNYKHQGILIGKSGIFSAAANSLCLLSNEANFLHPSNWAAAT